MGCTALRIEYRALLVGSMLFDRIWSFFHRCVCVFVCVCTWGLNNETVASGGVGRHRHYSQARIRIKYTVLFGRI